MHKRSNEICALLLTGYTPAFPPKCIIPKRCKQEVVSNRTEIHLCCVGSLATTTYQISSGYSCQSSGYGRKDGIVDTANNFNFRKTIRYHNLLKSEHIWILTQNISCVNKSFLRDLYFFFEQLKRSRERLPCQCFWSKPPDLSGEQVAHIFPRFSCLVIFFWSPFESWFPWFPLENCVNDHLGKTENT